MPYGPYQLVFHPFGVPRPQMNRGRKRGVTQPSARKPRRNRRKP